MGHITKLDPLATGCGRRVCGNRRLEPAVEDAGGHTLVPSLTRLERSFQQLVEPLAGGRRHRNHRHTFKLRKAVLERGTNAVEKAAGVLGNIPFVDGDDECAAFLDNMVGDFQVLYLKTFGRIEQQYDDFGKVDGVAGVGDRQLFELVLHLGPLAHPGGIDQANPAFVLQWRNIALFIGFALFRVRIVPNPLDRDAVARNARFRPGNQTLLAQQFVDECRFARIGSADDGQLQYGVMRLRVLDLERAAVDMRQQFLKQVGHAFTMLAADRDRFAKTERVAFENAVITLLALGLVDREHHGCIATPQPTPDFLVERSNARASVYQEQGNLCPRNRRLGLHPHPPGQSVRVFILIARRIDDGEFEIEQAAFALAPVAGDAGRVIDKRQLLANQPVEKSRLADIGPTDNGYRRQHCQLSFLFSGTPKPGPCHRGHRACCWQQR